jgi:hypothetical protein
MQREFCTTYYSEAPHTGLQLTSNICRYSAYDTMRLYCLPWYRRSVIRDRGHLRSKIEQHLVRNARRTVVLMYTGWLITKVILDKECALMATWSTVIPLRKVIETPRKTAPSLIPKRYSTRQHVVSVCEVPATYIHNQTVSSTN